MRKTNGRSASRRHFLKQAGAIALASLPLGNRSAMADSDSSDTKDTATIVKNRKPLAENAFYFLPLGAVRPAGWLERQMRVQANGLSGHLDETWADVGSNSGWLGRRSLRTSNTPNGSRRR